MKNSQIVKQILSTLETEHLNLYHDVTKEEIQKHIDSIKNIDELSSVEFDYEMLKLFALFKDAHTSYYIQWKPLNKRIRLIEDKFYIVDHDKYKQILSIGEMSIEKLNDKLVPLMNYETLEWLNHKIEGALNNGYIYQMIGLDVENGIDVEVVDNEVITLKIIEQQENSKSDKPKPYYYEILDSGILYFRYYACRENPDYPFANFILDLTKDVEKNNIKKYILDLRNNGGGDSEILNPFQALVRDKKLDGVLIINNGVFSSGRFAVARFKKEFNALLIGEPTGGAAKSYGQAPPLEIEGKRFSASKKFFDFTDIVDYDGAFQPDIFVPKTIHDVENQYDRQLAVAIELVKEKELD